MASTTIVTLGVQDLKRSIRFYEAGVGLPRRGGIPPQSGIRPNVLLSDVASTGGYERALVEALAEAGLPVILINPWRVRRFGEGLGILAKTDSIDGACSRALW